MKIIKLFTLALALTMFAYPILPLAAQEKKPAEEITIPDGTDFTVVTVDELSSKTASEDDPVNMKVNEDVTVNGRVVIAKGTLVKGVVSNVEQRGHLGKGGKLGLLLI